MHIYLIYRSRVLPKQMFSLGGKRIAVAQTKSSLSKRTLSTSSNISEQPNKKRKITSDNPDFTSIQTSDQV